MAEGLKLFLSKQYPTSRSANPIELDDQRPSDRPDLCCGMLAYLDKEDTFRLSLRNCPLDQGLALLIQSTGGMISWAATRADVEINLSANAWPFVRNLAEKIEQLVAPGRSYADPNWKWVCPRTAYSLQFFASRLEAYSRSPQAD
jgi:hypothetical protein